MPLKKCYRFDFCLASSYIHKEIDPSLLQGELESVAVARRRRRHQYTATDSPVSYPDRTYFYAAPPFRLSPYLFPRARSETVGIPGLGDGASYSFAHFLIFSCQRASPGYWDSVSEEQKDRE